MGRTSGHVREAVMWTCMCVCVCVCKMTAERRLPLDFYLDSFYIVSGFTRFGQGSELTRALSHSYPL